MNSLDRIVERGHKRMDLAIESVFMKEAVKLRETRFTRYIASIEEQRECYSSGWTDYRGYFESELT